MIATKARASGERSARAGSFERFGKVLLKCSIGEFSCLITTPDQVFTRFRLGVESVDEGAQTPADPIADDRVADLPTDRVSHGDVLVVRGPRHETDSK
jgi:hypothetical protein